MHTKLRRIHNDQKGFALVKTVIGCIVIAALAGIVITLCNPNRHFENVRNSQRVADITSILNAVYQYSLDNSALPSTITTTATEICATEANSCTGLINLSSLTAHQAYFISMPQDPKCSTSTACAIHGTGYMIRRSASNHIVVTAPHAENNQIIQVAR